MRVYIFDCGSEWFNLMKGLVLLNTMIVINYVCRFLIPRQNAILLEDKEKREKEVLSQIIKEAEDYKVEFHEKRELACENNKITNREREKVRLHFLFSCPMLPLFCSLFDNIGIPIY